ncbi:MAG: ATP-grasp domain-containing protein [Myxococcota bacterium]
MTSAARRPASCPSPSEFGSRSGCDSTNTRRRPSLRRHGLPRQEPAPAVRRRSAPGLRGARGGPVVLKSQVLSGGRMKAGAVRFADTADEAAAAAEAIKLIVVNGQTCRSILVEEKTPVAKEYFVAITWDGRAKRPVCVFSDMGGIDIEEVALSHPEHVSKTHFSTILPLSPRIAKEAVGATGVTDRT